MLSLFTICQSWLVTSTSAIAMRQRTRARGDAGQATAEYGMVVVGAAAVALMLIAWATKTDRIGKLFDLVVQNVSGHLQ